MPLPRGRDLEMIRQHLDGIPRHPLPDGYVLERWQPGDEENWLRIHRIADSYNDFTEESFRRHYGFIDTEWARRILFLRVAGGGPTVGTAGAWWNDNWRGGSWGRLHWVAIVPGHQGRGLARPLISTALHRLRELGHQRAYLDTNSVRPVAIRLYEEFGFAEAEP
jgi:GNAT superfamily N-acetyltransferase